MLRPSVCIDAVLGDLAPADAMKVVADAGINTFEFWGWWDKDLDELKAAQTGNDLAISACW